MGLHMLMNSLPSHHTVPSLAVKNSPPASPCPVPPPHPQGYEEARVCLHMLMNSIPAAIILGVLFDAIKAYSQFQ